MDLKSTKIEEAKSCVVFHLNCGQVDKQATAPSRDQPADPTQALYCPPGAPFGPVNFTEYPPNPAYLEFDLETILIADSLSRNRETEYIGRKGKWYKVPTLLFKDKYNYLPTYFVPMTLPLTPQPDCPLEPPITTETTSTQLFGVLCITLAGLVDSMVPKSGPWFLLGQSLSYIIKLAFILWWALPTGSAVPCPKSPNASNHTWLPGTTCKTVQHVDHHNEVWYRAVQGTARISVANVRNKVIKQSTTGARRPKCLNIMVF
ncbi:hypothetical protein DSO57_1012952 [Entomophthora muscae]|uniref:Uncharacterized protein n=1 Tax=Entomophthora muscae TaxID=34485 RepID=A0ACC2SVH8_9FUNG|nr:hypothetical protein DSO57_1012952 [Entomophthora muscae]